MATDDIEAINVYIRGQYPKTPEAVKLQANWSFWYNGLNFITKSLDSTLTEANNRRNIYNAANLQPLNLDIAADLTPEQKIQRQAAIAASPALSPTQKAKAIAKSPNTPTSLGAKAGSASHATIRQGSKGNDVIAWQKILGLSADGKFGPGTFAATKKFQSAHGLTPDGVVGSKTWSAALGTTVQEAPTQTFNTAANQPFVAQAQAPSVKPTATNASNTVKPSVAQTASAAIVKTTSPVLKYGIPAVGLLAGGWIWGIPGAVIGGALGLFGSTKV
jgi:peptidoglycan hydrolase-like protein with peptidoglycan-binding domain